MSQKPTVPALRALHDSNEQVRFRLSDRGFEELSSLERPPRPPTSHRFPMTAAHLLHYALPSTTEDRPCENHFGSASKKAPYCSTVEWERCSTRRASISTPALTNSTSRHRTWFAKSTMNTYAREPTPSKPIRLVPAAINSSPLDSLRNCTRSICGEPKSQEKRLVTTSTSPEPSVLSACPSNRLDVSASTKHAPISQNGFALFEKEAWTSSSSKLFCTYPNSNRPSLPFAMNAICP